ncbi:MAG: DUF1501 domain-containing protein [Saprospiraceae bacterium]|nr:DUF1501 domain-containing protein [Saprospiraceae bacterium]
MLIKRRDFLKTATLATTSLWLPRFLHGYQQPGVLQTDGKILVVLQLSGGNDGLNTFIPVRNDVYYRERPRLAIERDKTLALTSEVGLHPALGAMKKLYDNGHLGVLHNVGYPNSDRSHFRSMDIWHSGSSANDYVQTGWLGRYLDASCNGSDAPKNGASRALEIDDTLSLVLKGEQMKGLALQDPKRLYESAKSPYFSDYVSDRFVQHEPDARPFVTSSAGSPEPHDHEAPADYLYKTMSETLASADYLYTQSKKQRSTASYPSTGLGKNFKTIASLILSDTDTSIYYLSHGSFDTHVNQQGQQQRLFQEMNDALEAFCTDMQQNGRWNDVLVVTFSEFGRRVAQNASGGTDHGKANPMVFMGGALKQQGLLNDLPDLTRLDDGDLTFNIDFRQVYATLLQNWLQTDARLVLNAPFTPMNFI